MLTTRTGGGGGLALTRRMGGWGWRYRGARGGIWRYRGARGGGGGDGATEAHRGGGGGVGANEARAEPDLRPV